MRSTPVKDMNAVMMNLTAVQPGRGSGNGSFQKIWNSQMGKGTGDSQGAAEKQNTESRKTEYGAEGNTLAQSRAASKLREEQKVPDECGKQTDEMSPEELERAMELLEAGAMELMQQIADAFGITLEEVQAVMGDLNLTPVDLMDASVLGNLILQLGGAADASALVTDEALYGNYRMLMEQLQGALQEAAGELDLDPEMLAELVKDSTDVEALPEEGPASREPAGLEGLELKESDKADGGQNTLAGPELLSEESDAISAGWQETGKTSEQGNRQAESGRRQPQGEGGKGEHANVLIQNIRTEQFQPGGIQPEHIPQESQWTAQTRDIMNQIMDYMKLQAGPDTTSLEMQLHPASLGTLQVQIASRGGIVTANFITQNEAVKAALESQMIQLKESFEEQGVKVEAIEVTVQTHTFERNLEQGRGRNQQESEKRSRTRRISLGGTQTAEDSGDEDMLAADMLAMDGSTVNYTA